MRALILPVAFVATQPREGRALQLGPRVKCRVTACSASVASRKWERGAQEDRHGSLTPCPASVHRPLPRDPELYIDNVDLSNPLQRAERLGTGWMGVIVELEGVLVDYDARRVSDQAWQHLAEEEGRPPLPLWALRKAEGMKNEQVLPWEERWCVVWGREGLCLRDRNVLCCAETP